MGAGCCAVPVLGWWRDVSRRFEPIVKYSGWLFTVGLFGAIACSVYDPSLVQPQQRAPTWTAGQSAAGSGGRDGASGAATGGIGEGAAGSAGDAGTAGAMVDPGGPLEPGVLCGDGRVDSSEKCDTGIASGVPGACPTECEAPGACQRVMLAGSGCQSECRVLTLGCIAGDRCCPAACDAAEDLDCSGMCGDGIVQADLLETCEPGSQSKPCPSLADCEDDEPCTRDAISGSAEHCNAACTHTPITTPQAGDACCPSGANATTDSDCTPRCGNGVREGTEACDLSTGCDANCNLTLNDAQIQCLDRLAETACERCECMRCSAEMTACMASGDATRDAACTAVEACAVAKNCAGSACYCGDAQAAFDCALRANGPCKDVVEAAAGTTSPSRIDAQGKDSNTALGRAQNLGTCRRAQCSAECS